METLMMIWPYCALFNYFYFIAFESYIWWGLIFGPIGYAAMGPLITVPLMLRPLVRRLEDWATDRAGGPLPNRHRVREAARAAGEG